MTALHVYGRWLRCRALAWDCTAEAACAVALWAWRRSTEATECSELVMARALEREASDA